MTPGQLFCPWVLLQMKPGMVEQEPFLTLGSGGWLATCQHNPHSKPEQTVGVSLSPVGRQEPTQSFPPSSVKLN